MGWTSVEVVAGVAWPWNWEDRSVYCLRREARVVARELALLVGG